MKPDLSHHHMAVHNGFTECIYIKQFSCLHGKAELLVEKEYDGTDAVPCNLDHVEGFAGSKEHAHVKLHSLC